MRISLPARQERGNRPWRGREPGPAGVKIPGQVVVCQGLPDGQPPQLWPETGIVFFAPGDFSSRFGCWGPAAGPSGTASPFDIRPGGSVTLISRPLSMSTEANLS